MQHLCDIYRDTLPHAKHGHIGHIVYNKGYKRYSVYDTVLYTIRCLFTYTTYFDIARMSSRKAATKSCRFKYDTWQTKTKKKKQCVEAE